MSLAVRRLVGVSQSAFRTAVHSSSFDRRAKAKQGQGKEFVFFRFLSLKKDDEMALSLGHLLDHFNQKSKQDTQDYRQAWPLLLKVQSACVADFGEKLRLGNGVDFAERLIPPFLQAASLDDKQWFLANDVASDGSLIHYNY